MILLTFMHRNDIMRGKGESIMGLEIQLRDVAKAHGFKSAKELSIKTGLNYAAIARYWQGGSMERVSLPVLDSIAKELGVKAKELLVEYDN